LSYIYYLHCFLALIDNFHCLKSVFQCVKYYMYDDVNVMSWNRKLTFLLHLMPCHCSCRLVLVNSSFHWGILSIFYIYVSLMIVGDVVKSMENNWLVLLIISFNVYHIFVWSNWLTTADHLIYCMTQLCMTSCCGVLWFFSVCIVFMVFRHFVLSKRFVVLRLSFSSTPTSLLISLHFPTKRSTFYF
jgi:hypothetical protein